MPGEQARQDFIASWAASLPSLSRVLDAGAGDCPFRSWFNHCVYTAQDMRPSASIAVVCQIYSLPFDTGFFDAVLCTEVLEHLTWPEEAIAELSRVLKPNGTLCLTAPLTSGIHQAPVHYYGGFSRYWYERILPDHALDIVTMESNGGFFRLYGQETERVTSFFPWPIKLVLWPWCRWLIPWLCRRLDTWDTAQEFSIGSLVVARRR